MYKVKKYMIAICIMVATAFVALLVVSTLTYVFKWQADKAMIGIIVTYVFAGGVGGYFFDWKKKREDAQRIEIGKKLRAALILSFVFILLLILCSNVGFHIPFSFSSRLILIWLLVASSSLGGMCVKG